MNVPNALTVSRLVMAPVLIALLSLHFPLSKTLALLVFLAAAVSDALDGWLARTRYGTTPFGQLMDPLADKILTCAALVTFAGIRLPAWDHALVPAWMVVVIISREFLVTGLRLLAANRNRVIAAGRWGKHKTIWQMVYISMIILLLAVRFDFLQRSVSNPAVLARFDFWVGVFAWTLGAFVVCITLVSGWIYYREHHDLITGEMSSASMSPKTGESARS